MHTTETQAHSGHPVATVTITPLASAGGLHIANEPEFPPRQRSDCSQGRAFGQLSGLMCRDLVPSRVSP